MMRRKVEWSERASKQIKAVYDYIAKESEQAADSVTMEIKVYLMDTIARYPEMKPADREKKNNDGSYRAFEMHRYRISYKIFKDAILIIRLRHTSQQPQQY